MPWLSAGDVARLACTCWALARAAASLTRLRITDVTRGLEPFPVPIVNTVDRVLYPSFLYIPFCSFGSSHFLSQPWGRLPLPNVFTSTCNAASSADVFGFIPQECTYDQTILDSGKEASPFVVDRLPPPKKQRGCRCEGSENSLCGRTLNGEFAYDGCSRLRFVRDGLWDVERNSRADTISILECGTKCSCNLNCKYRVTQRGLGVKVALVRDPLKGWGLRAAQSILAGCFVCEYAGELVTTKEAQSRQISYDRLRRNQQKFVSALLVVREHLPSGQSCLRMNIDATRFGNVARFLNHACDGGNLLPCLVRSTGSIIPRLTLFARKDIGLGEELTFSYGDVHEALQTEICLCGTASCKGVMPSEET